MHAIDITMNEGPKNSVNARNPPQILLVIIMESAMISWVEVGPGTDWQIAVS